MQEICILFFFVLLKQRGMKFNQKISKKFLNYQSIATFLMWVI